MSKIYMKSVNFIFLKVMARFLLLFGLHIFAITAVAPLKTFIFHMEARSDLKSIFTASLWQSGQ